MTPDEASARAREAVHREVAAYVRDRKYGSQEMQIKQSKRLDAALDALVRLERARGAVEALEDAECDYDGGQCPYCAPAIEQAEAELTAAITALEDTKG